MAEVGRLAVGEPARLPGGFWAAAGVWLERPQVANKRLCGARLEARLSVVLGGGPEPPDPPRDPGGPALAALWARVSRGLAARHPALLAFLSDPARPRPRPLQLLLRSVVPKASPRCPLAAPRRELVVQGTSAPRPARQGRGPRRPAGEGDSAPSCPLPFGMDQPPRPRTPH